jgi:hypothetical protein
MIDDSGSEPARGRRVRIRDHVLHRPVADEIVLLDLDGNRLHGLDGVAAFLWREMAAETAALDELATRVAERYRVAPERAAADVERFVAELVEAGLVDLEGP